MTVCIAATCGISTTPRIVICTDWRISGALGSAETRLKQRQLTKGWMCLTAGHDSDILDLMKFLTNVFRHPPGGKIDETNIGKIVRDSLNSRMREKIEELVRGRWGFSYDDFLTFGKDKLPPDLFRETAAAISDVSLRAECIIAGFCEGDPMLLQTGEKCQVSIKEDFATIGEGAYLAQSALLQREHSDIKSLERTIYAVFEAKKYAERVASVGPQSTIAVIEAADSRFITRAGREFLEAKYRDFGPRHVPNEIEAPENYLRKYSDGPE